MRRCFEAEQMLVQYVRRRQLHHQTDADAQHKDIIELADDGDEVGNDVDGRCEVDDERRRYEADTPGYAAVLHEAPSEAQLVAPGELRDAPAEFAHLVVMS